MRKLDEQYTHAAGRCGDQYLFAGEIGGELLEEERGEPITGYRDRRLEVELLRQNDQLVYRDSRLFRVGAEARSTSDNALADPVLVNAFTDGSHATAEGVARHVRRLDVKEPAVSTLPDRRLHEDHISHLDIDDHLTGTRDRRSPLLHLHHIRPTKLRHNSCTHIGSLHLVSALSRQPCNLNFG